MRLKDIFRKKTPAHLANRDDALDAVRKNWRIIKELPDRFLNDREIVLAAVLQNPEILTTVPLKFSEDRDLIMTAARENGNVLAHAAEWLKNDRAVVLAAVRQSGLALVHAAESLKDDHEIVLAAVTQNGTALVYAQDGMRDDEEVARAACRNNGAALIYVSARLKNDRAVCTAAVTRNYRMLQHVGAALQNDPDICRTALTQNVYLIKDFSDENKNNPDAALFAVRQNGMALKHVSAALQDNPGLVATAIKQNWRAVHYASERLQRDKDITRLAAEEKNRQSSGRKQGVNFLWLNLDLPPKPDPEDGSIRMPMPEEYIDNLRQAAARHPDADMNLWIDSRRLTEKQLAWLTAVTEGGLPNVRVKDLCDIPAYKNEELYSRAETKKNWRFGYGGVVWLQVDAAKILISLQGDYDQSFFADLDHAHIDIRSKKVQDMMQENGLLIGTAGKNSSDIENQLWGFDRSRRKFFEDYYAAGIKGSYQDKIAYHKLHSMLEEALFDFEDMDEDSIRYRIGSAGLDYAVQPGHEWVSGALGVQYEGRTAVPAAELAATLDGKNPKPAAPKPVEKKPASAVTAPPQSPMCP